jgi:hypothetical protein
LNLIYFPIRKSWSTVALAQAQQVFDPGLVATGDFNRDDKLDLAIGNGCIDTSCAGTVDVYMGNGDGTFGMPIRTVVPGDGSPTSGDGRFLADFNADAKPDVAITLNSGDGFESSIRIHSLGQRRRHLHPKAWGASVWLRLQLAI